MLAVYLVFRRPWNIALATTAFAAMEVFYLWNSQVLTISPNGLSYLIEPDFLVAGTVIALLFGIEVPLIIRAVSLAAASASQTGGTVIGALLGVASMTCCAPVVLPPILSLLGATGTSILGLDTALHRFWLPLATASVVCLVYSLVSLVQNINLECRILARTSTEEFPPASGRQATG